jgi:hypothetical protein
MAKLCCVRHKACYVMGRGSKRAKVRFTNSPHGVRSSRTNLVKANAERFLSLDDARAKRERRSP